MKIAPNQVFLDGEDRYLEGIVYDVPIEKGTYFVGNGWADAIEMATGTPSPVADLDIHNASVGIKDSNG